MQAGERKRIGAVHLPCESSIFNAFYIAQELELSLSMPSF